MAERNGIFNRLMGRIHEMQNYRRLIDREVAMVDLGKIVLCHEFNECIFDRNPDSHFIRTYTGRQEEFLSNMGEVIEVVPEVFFSIPLNRLTKNSLTLVHNNLEKQAKRHFGVLATMGIDPKRHAFFTPLPEAYIGTYLGVLVLCLNKTGFRDFSAQARQWSILRGEGQVVLDFWKAVNNLHDYSDLFPDKEPPRFGGPKMRPEKKAPAWQEAVTSAFKPIFVPEPIPIPVRR